MAVKLIAFDLDYTLLDSEKRLSAENLAALTLAAEKGIYTVPATGRLYNGLPEEIKNLPSFRWCILGNGARIYDAANDITAAAAEIPLADAFEIFDFMESVGLRYDCYAGDSAWIERKDFDELDTFIEDKATCRFIRSVRTPVDGLREFLKANFDSILKIQVYFEDPELRLRMLRELPERYPKLGFSSSIPVNMEINSKKANKGAGLMMLCDYLGIDVSETAAFGDGLNDMEMIETAGIGIAMANAEEKLKAAADMITGSCEESGVAQGIRKIVLNEGKNI